MPRTRSLAWSELKIGILTVTALALAVFLIFLVGGQGGLFARKYHLKTRFGNAMGLKPGALVRVGGVEVGQIDKMEFVGARIEVTLELRRDMQERVTTNSRAAVGSLSLLGESVVEINPSATGQPLADWAYIQAGPPPAVLADVTASASEGITELTALLRDVRGGKGTVGKLLTDEAVYRDMSALLAAAERVVANLNQGRGTLGQLLNDPAAYRSLRASLGDLEVMTRRLNAGEGSLGRLLQDDQFARSLSATTGSLEQLTGRLNRGEGTAGKLLNDAALYNRLNALSERIDTLMVSLNQGEGTAGQLLRDKRLYENMNGAVTELRSLLTDVRKDPKKFLNVRVSIF
jgi:phospholipid/cholesterol/gamma-HCH transport system substrate-binding protein